MDVFVTGGTGYVGRAVVRALLEGGHRLSVLTRSHDQEPRLLAVGVRPVHGDLRDSELLHDEARRHEAVIHIGLDFDDPRNVDRIATLALIDGARERAHDGVLVYTSGCWVLGDTKGIAAEDAATDHPADVSNWRPEHERAVLEGATAPLSTAVIRPGLVYGDRGGLISPLFLAAKERGAADIIERGDNRWSLVHRDDLAALYRRVVEERARGIFHGVDGHPLPAKEVARAASLAAGACGKTRSLTLDEARDRLGLVADALHLDQALSAPRAAELGWRPTWPAFDEAATRAYEEWLGEERALP